MGEVAGPSIRPRNGHERSYARDHHAVPRFQFGDVVWSSVRLAGGQKRLHCRRARGSDVPEVHGGDEEISPESQGVDSKAIGKVMAVSPEHIDEPEVRLKGPLPPGVCLSDTPMVKLRAEVVDLTRQGRELGLEGKELADWVHDRNPNRVDQQDSYERRLMDIQREKRVHIDAHGCPFYSTGGIPYLTYFAQEIENGHEGPIKIGRVTAHPFSGKGPGFHVRTRVNSMQSCNPRQLVIHGWTYHHRERDVQKRFAHLRIRGEWFRPAAELLVFIDEVCDDD